MWASALMAVAAGALLLLGTLHLVYTFRGTRLHPRDPALVDAMRATPLMLTRDTTTWRAWIGFNASHSLGAMLFGLVYGYLALVEPALLFASVFLQALALATLGTWLWLGLRYWFRVPLAGIALAAACALAACIAARFGVA